VVSVLAAQASPVPAAPRREESLLFAADDAVLPSHPASPVFGDLRWDLSILGLAANQPASDAVVNFGRFLAPVCPRPAAGAAQRLRLAPAWLLRAKELLAILLAPTRCTSHRRIDVYQLRQSSSPGTVKATLAQIYALAVWATVNALPADLDRWEQDDLDDFLAYLATERTNARTGGKGIDPASIRSYVNTLRTLHLLRDTLTDGGLRFDPWQGRSAESVTGVDLSVRRTKPIPAEQYQPLMRNLWKVIDQIAPDVLAAAKRADALNRAPLQTWWPNVNQQIAADEIAGTDAILAHRNLAPTMQAFRRLLRENPDISLASDADVQQRSGIRYQWFSRNRQRLIDAGILQRVHPPKPAAPDRASWQATEQAQRPLGPPPPQLCGRDLRARRPRRPILRRARAALPKRRKARHRHVDVQSASRGTDRRLALPPDGLLPRSPHRRRAPERLAGEPRAPHPTTRQGRTGRALQTQARRCLGRRRRQPRAAGPDDRRAARRAAGTRGPHGRR